MRIVMRGAGRIAGALLLAASSSGWASAADVSVMPVAMPDDPEKVLAEARRIEDEWLAIDFAGALAALETGSPLAVPFGEAERADLEALGCATCGNRRERRLAVGIERPTDAEVSLAGAGKAVPGDYVGTAGGVATVDKEGRLRWTLAISTPGASASRLHIEGLNVPAGLELRTFGTGDLEVFGPYPSTGPVGDGDLWTNTVAGESHFLEVRSVAPEFNGLVEGLGFRISEVAVFSPERYSPPGSSGAEGSEKRCSYNALCIENAECYDAGDYPGIALARGAAAHILFSVGNGQYICSGGLINDAGSTFTPYFLTANHCFDTQASATSAEFYFEFRRASCGSACNDPSIANRALGASLLATRASSDFSFMRISGALPAGRAFLGWTSAQVHNQLGLQLYRISHPLGAPQSYSRHVVISPDGTCSGLPLGDFLYITDVEGATEGGSSGSPVTNADGQVVGQLLGACGFNVDDVCDNVTNYTVDGAFRKTFDTINQWLVPGAVATAFYGAVAPVYVDVDDPRFGGQSQLAALDPKTGATLVFDPAWTVNSAGIAIGVGDLRVDSAKGAPSGEVPLTGKMRYAASAKSGFATWKNAVSLKGTTTIDGQKASASLKGSENFAAVVASPNALVEFSAFPGFAATASLAIGSSKAKAVAAMTNVEPDNFVELDHAGYTVFYSEKNGSMSGASETVGPFPPAAGTLSGKVAWQTSSKVGTVQIKMSAGGFTASNRGAHTVTYEEFDDFATAAQLEQRWSPTAIGFKSAATSVSWK